MEREERAWVAPEAGGDAPVLAGRPASTPVDVADRFERAIEPPAPVGPMTLSDILDGSFTILTRRPRAVIGSVALVIVPVQVFAAWLRSTSDASVESASPYQIVLNLGTSTSFGLTLVIAAISSLSLFFVGGIVSSFVGAWYSGIDIGAREALRRAFRRTGAFLVAGIVLLPLKAVSYALCILPLAVTVTFFALTAPAITLERIGPFAGIKRSAQLIARRFWPSLGIVLLASLVETVVQLSLSAIPMIVASFVPAPFDWMVVAMGDAAGALVATTALVGASVLLYVDLRTRTEGLDLELRAADAFGPAS